MAKPLELRRLEAGDESALGAAVSEFAVSDPGWDFDLRGASESFAAYLARLWRLENGAGLPSGRVPSSFWVAWVGDRIVGRAALRHHLSDSLLEFGGHVGFGVVASSRGRGYATEILRQVLAIASDRGMKRLLATCADENLASQRVIERCGGVFVDTRPRREGGLTRRYWIGVGPRPLSG